MGAVTGGRGYVGLLAFWMFTLAETRWWHLKQVDDGVPVLRDWSKQRGLSERTNNAENFVSDAQHEVQLSALLRHSQDGGGLSSTQTARTHSDLCAVELCLAYQAVSALEPHLVGVDLVCINGVSASGISVIAVWDESGDIAGFARDAPENSCPKLISRGLPAELRSRSSALWCRLFRLALAWDWSSLCRARWFVPVA